MSPPGPPAPPHSSSCCSFSSHLLLLLLLLPPLLPRCGATEDAAVCAEAFRRGRDDFVLDAEDAVSAGAAPLATVRVPAAEECERACCENARCNLALLKPRGATHDTNRTCDLFSCVHRNQFVCRFVREDGYQTYVRGSVYRKYLEPPQGPGERVPPIAITGRDVIVQPGTTVTLNGKESLPLDDITDYRWSQLSGDSGVKMEETDLRDQVQLSNLRPGRYVFQLTVTDAAGQSHAANATVLVLSPELSSLYCRAPVKVGPCRASFPRWRYNAATGACEQFVYGGCKPNKNNFLSEKECVSACSGVTESSERSNTPVGALCGSPCRPNQLTCDDGCCLDDRTLECDGVSQCNDASDEEHCSKLNHTFSQLLSINVNQRKADCTEPPFTGPCRASHTRWFYNPLHQKCFTFTFGGCDANRNNFQEEKKCSEACSGVTEQDVFSRGLFERFEKDDDSDSGSVALAVVLSVAILALLAILTYCFLKARRERSHRPVATSPAHVALSEQDTLVYTTTTKPV